MPFLISLEYRPGDVERGAMPLGSNEKWAREIIEQRMRTCRENDWPMLTMALLWQDESEPKLVDTLYRSGHWHSDIADACG